MSTELSCSSCDSCQGCDSCQLCNTSCNSEGECNTLQVFCEKCQTYGEYQTFDFSKCADKDEIIGPGYFDKTVWDNFIEQINNVRTKGEESSSGDAIDSSTYDNVVPFKASEFNRIADYINTSRSVSSNDIIYGSYFGELLTGASNTRLSESACDKCNTGCDATCDKCQKCDTEEDGLDNKKTDEYCCDGGGGGSTGGGGDCTECGTQENCTKCLTTETCTDNAENCSGNHDQEYCEESTNPCGTCEKACQTQCQSCQLYVN